MAPETNICGIHKAIQTASRETPNLNIIATEEFPAFENLAQSRSLFRQEAKAIFEALSHSLPGGTLDHLLALMLEKKASHFRVLSWDTNTVKE